MKKFAKIIGFGCTLLGIIVFMSNVQNVDLIGAFMDGLNGQ